MKRTLAFIISVMMVLSLIPASLLTALANGTGTAGNYVENLSIDNAKFDDTEVPASIVADGKLDDTGWIRDQWNKVSSATGTWDVVTPAHSNLVYEYQIQRDHQFLYGAYSFDMQTVESGTPATVTLWLNDGTDGEAYWTQRIDITITVNGDDYTTTMKRWYRGSDGTAMPVDENDVYLYSKNEETGEITYKYFINDEDYYVLAEAPACVAVRDTQYNAVEGRTDEIINDKVIVEFRTLLDVFSDQKAYDKYCADNSENSADFKYVYSQGDGLSERDTITHITSASFGDGGALYYPRLDVGEANREMVDPSVSWPSNSIEISEADVLNNDGTADYNNVLPSGIDVDGVFSEGVWSHISDFCQYGWAAGGMTDDYRAEGTYGGADLATFKNKYYKDTKWGSGTSTTAVATNTDAVRFKYDIGFDSTYIYGAMVIYSDEAAVEHCGSKNKENALTIAFQTDDKTFKIKLYDSNGEKADDNFTQNDIQILSGDDTFRWKIDGSTVTGGYSYFNDHYFVGTTANNADKTIDDMLSGMSAKRVSKYLVQVCFRFKYAEAYTNFVPENSGYRFEVSDAFGNTAYSGSSASEKNYRFNSNHYNSSRMFADSLKIASGGLDQRSWPNMYAADNHVDYMVRSEVSMYQATNAFPTLSTIETYSYKLLTDYDYLYGAAVVWDTEAWKKDSATITSETDCFRLWINSGTSLATGDVWDITLSFYLEGTTPHTYLQGKYTPYNGATAYMLTMHDPAGIEVAIKENPNGTESPCDGSEEIYNEYLIEFKIPLSYLMKSIEDGAPSYSDSDVTVTETVDGVEYKTTYSESPVFNAVVSAGQWNNNAYGLFHSEIISGNNFRIYDNGNLAYYSNYPVADINYRYDGDGIYLAPSWAQNTLGISDLSTVDYTIDLVGWPEDSDMTFTYDQREGTGERLDYFNLDGRLEEFFWNNEAERVKVNGGNGYWAQVPATSEDFDYEYRIYTGTENLYGAFKVNAAAVTDQTKMTIWFNVDGRDGASHKLEFWMDENTSGEYEKNDNNFTVAWTLTGPDGVEIATSGTRLSDGGHEDYLRAVMKTINDETVLEFVMDLDVIDTAKDTVTNYNSYWKNFWYPVFSEATVGTERTVYGLASESDYSDTVADNTASVLAGKAIATGWLTHVFKNSSNGNAYYIAKNGGENSTATTGFIISKPQNYTGNTHSYGKVAYYYEIKNGHRFVYSDAERTQLVTSVSDVPTTSYFWYGDEYTAGALPQYPNYVKDGFEYVVGVSQPVGDETLTLYHNGNGEETFWVTGYDYNVDASVGLILTPDESSTTDIWEYAYKYVFKSTGYDGIYKVVAAIDGAQGNAKTIAELVSTYELTAENGDFIYVLHEGDDSKQHTYAEHACTKAKTDFAVGNYIQFSNLVVADKVQYYSEYAYHDSVPNTVNKGSILNEVTVDGTKYDGLRGDSLGSSIDMFDTGYAPLADYRVISADDYAAKVDETYLPATGGWSSRALEVAPLLDYKIEYITVDGDLTDNGWAEDGWTYVDSDVNSNLQTIVYDTPSGITDGDAEYTYKYQIRTDGEYIYVAAVLDIGMQVATGETSNPYAEPFFRVWFNSHPERDKGDDGNDYNRLTFTQRYEIIANKGGTSDEYTVATPNFDARTYLNGWSAEDTVNMNKGSSTVNYNYGDITDDEVDNPQAYLTYNNVKLNVGGFSWTTAEGEIDYANPSGGVEHNPEVNGDKANSTVTNTYKYEDSSFFGETIITEENTTSGYGANDKDPTSPVSADPTYGSDFDDGWVAERELRKVTYGNQHATMKEVTTADGVTQTQVEFRIKIDEVADENGEFEYTVFAGLDYGQDLVMFYPMVDKEAGIYFPSGYDRFYNPNWFWPTNHFEWNAEVERDLMLRSPYEPVVNIGSQYFEAYPYTEANEDGSYPSGLRLGGYYIQDYIHRQIRDDYGFSDYEEWDYWDVLEAGILYIPSQKYKVDDGTANTGLKVLSPTEITSGATDAEADNILNWQQVDGHLQTCFADYQSFIYYAVIVGIPQNQVNLKYSYRCYMDYYGNDGKLNYEGTDDYYVDYYREAASSNLVPVYENGKAKYDSDGNLVMANVDCKGELYMETDADGNIILTDGEPTPLYSDFYAPVITRSSTMAKSDLDGTAQYEQSYTLAEDGETKIYIPYTYTYYNTESPWGDKIVGYNEDGSEIYASSTEHQLGDIATFQYYFKNKTSDGNNTTTSGVAGAKLGYIPFENNQDTYLTATTTLDEVEPSNNERVEYLAAAAGYDLQMFKTVSDAQASEDILYWVICVNDFESNWEAIKEFSENKNVIMYYPYIWNSVANPIPDNLKDNLTVISDFYAIHPNNAEGNAFISGGYSGLLSVAAFTNKFVGSVNLHINHYGEKLNVVETIADKIGATVNYNNTEAIEVLVLNSTEVKVVDNLISDLRNNLAESVPTVVINAVEGAQGHEFNDPDKAILVDFDELLIDIPNIGRLLGYSSWKDAGTSTAIALSNGIARYSFLKNGIDKVDEDVVTASHKGFVQSLAFSLVSDIAYEIDYLKADVSDAGNHNLGVAALRNKAFQEKSAEIANYINCSDIISKVTDSVVRTDLFDGGKLMIGSLEYDTSNSQISGLPSLESGYTTDDVVCKRANFEMYFTDGINHAYEGEGGNVYINTALDIDTKKQYTTGTPVLRDTSEVGYSYDYDGMYGSIDSDTVVDGEINVNLSGKLNDGSSTPTLIGKVLPEIITHEDAVNGSMNFVLGVESNKWFAFVDDRVSYDAKWYWWLIGGGKTGYTRLEFVANSSTTDTIEYTTARGETVTLQPSTNNLIFPNSDVLSMLFDSKAYQYKAYIEGYGIQKDSSGNTDWTVGSNDQFDISLWYYKDSSDNITYYPLMYASGHYYVLSHAALYTAYWTEQDARDGVVDGFAYDYMSKSGAYTNANALDFDLYTDSNIQQTTNQTTVYLTYQNFGRHYYYIQANDGSWRKIYFNYDNSYSLGYTFDQYTITEFEGNETVFDAATKSVPKNEGFSNSTSYSEYGNGIFYSNVNNGDGTTTISYKYGQYGYGEIIIDLGSSQSLEVLRLHLGNAASAMSWGPTVQVYTSNYSGNVIKGQALPNDMVWDDKGYAPIEMTLLDEHVYWSTKGLDGANARYIKLRFTLNNGDCYYIDEVEVYGSPEQGTVTNDDKLIAATYNVGQMREVFYNTAEYNFSSEYTWATNSVAANGGNGYDPTIGGNHGKNDTAGYVMDTTYGITTAAKVMGDAIASLNNARLNEGNAEIGVIMLQEVQQYVQKYGAMDQLKLMAKAAGYDYFYYAAANEYDAGGLYEGQADYYFETQGIYDDPTTRMDNPTGGCAIMSKYPIVAARTFYQDSGSQSIAYAQINFNGKLVDVYSAHFAANGSDRVATHDNRMDQYALLNHILKGRTEYSVVGGDFNERWLTTYGDNVDGMNNLLNTYDEKYVTMQDKKGNRKVIDNILIDGGTVYIENENYVKVYNQNSDVLCNNDDNPNNVMGFSDHYMALTSLTIADQ